MPDSSPWDGPTGPAPSPEPPALAGSMRVEAGAIPNLVKALQSSLDAVGVQIEHAITELRIQPWAGDPVSVEAAERFNEYSVGGDRAALTALCGYRDRLQAAAEALQSAETSYRDTEEANVTRLQSGC